jgi:hypothetical protein
VDNEPKEEGSDGAIDAPSREASKKLFWPVWWLVVYGLTVDSYLTGSHDLARTLGVVALTLLILKLSVVPLVRALYGRWVIERERRRSPEGEDHLPKSG